MLKKLTSAYILLLDFFKLQNIDISRGLKNQVSVRLHKILKGIQTTMISNTKKMYEPATCKCGYLLNVLNDFTKCPSLDWQHIKVGHAFLPAIENGPVSKSSFKTVIVCLNYVHT